MAESLDRIVEHGQGLAQLADHAKRLWRATYTLQRGLPPFLQQGWRVVNVQDGVLSIHADNGSVATRLKQMVPTLVQGMQLGGWPIQDIQIKVRVQSTPQMPKPAPVPRTIPASAATSLNTLLDYLPEDSPLRDNIDRLVRLSQGR